ncbi:MAG: SGNH/GDSL hydrolase family protein [Planctomycetota bacterium]
MTQDPSFAGRQRLMRLVAVLFGLVVALAAACAFLLLRAPNAPEAVVLPTRAGDLADSEIFTPVPDPGLDFVFYPGLRNDPSWKTKVPLSTNWAGMRDPRELKAKAAGVYRVVLLGDSMIAAQAAPYEDGVAPQLERLLGERAEKPAGIARFEVLPIAVSGWNLFAEVRFCVHNLHVLQPDLVVLALNRNDMDSGSGFVVGHTLTSIYDVQRLRGAAHSSLGSPTYFLRRPADCWGLVASDLIPESRRRFEMAGREVGDLQQRLAAVGAAFFVYLYDDYLAPGLERTLPASIDRRDVVLGPREVTDHNLLPQDGHPDGIGHAHLAKVLATQCDRRGHLRVPGLADVAAFHDLAEAPVAEAKTRETFAVARIPSGFAIVDGAMDPADGVRCVVGGVYPHGVLSPDAVFALRSERRPRGVEVELDVPDVPALRGGTLRVLVGGREAASVPLHGVKRVEAAIPGDAEISDLVEVRLVADCYFTNPTQGLAGEVWEAAPRIGTLRALRLLVE